MAKILIVDDEPRIRELIREHRNRIYSRRKEPD